MIDGVDGGWWDGWRGRMMDVGWMEGWMDGGTGDRWMDDGGIMNGWKVDDGWIMDE